MSSIVESPPASASAKPSAFERITGVLVAPEETFTDIARRPDWVVPLVLWTVLSLAGGIIMAKKVDFSTAAREAIDRRDMPPDAAESAVKLGAMAGKMSAYAAPLFVVIFFLIVAAVLLLIFRMFGAEGTFAQAFSTTLYAWVPNVIQSVIFQIVLLAGGGDVDVTRIQTVVRSNPAFLVDPKAHPILFQLLGSLDAFRIWTLILFVIGFAAVGRTSKGKSASIVVTLWLLVVLLSLIPAALRSMQ